MQQYEHMNLIGGVFSINHFKMEGRGNEDYPRYERYSFNRDNWEIVISKNTYLIRVNADTEHNFPVYPKVPLLRSLATDTSTRRMLTGILFIIFWFFFNI